MNNFVKLYMHFFKISAMTFGGGYAMMPMVEKELVEANGLLSHTDVIDDYAMGQTIPGVIGVNSSALMGYRISGRLGLLAAVLGFITPSIIIISIISTLLMNIPNQTIVEKIFRGLRAGVVALMLNSLVNISKKTLLTMLCYILFLLSFIGITLLSLHPFVLILSGGAISVIHIYVIKRDKK